MPQYYIWTIGCQMNKAESAEIAAHFEMHGYDVAATIEHADVIVLNTCMVRQSAEEKVIGMLGYLKGIKYANPKLCILVTGCFVDSCVKELERRYPHVNLFFKPGAHEDMNDWAEKQGWNISSIEAGLPLTSRVAPCIYVPIILGCDNFCSYCIVPYRRGRERSRPLPEVVGEINKLSRRGAREITLLGQNVNSYGHDLPSGPNLGDLLTEICTIESICRVRFLTNHPKDMSQMLAEKIASLDKVCKHINLPFQSGDNYILREMRRGYTIEQYMGLIDMLRSIVPGIGLSTDVIVGFPGETEQQFIQTLAVIEEVRFDTVHAAAYSPRTDTIAARKYKDDIPPEIKRERLDKIEVVQARISSEINSRLLGRTLEILVEGKKKGKLYGRTRNDKLAFFEDKEVGLIGKLVNIEVNKTSPWSLQGKLVSCEDFVGVYSADQLSLTA